jgi:hypothetical protein
MMTVLPDKRLQTVVPLAVRGILGSETPIVTQMAQTVARTESGVWAAAKRIYRFLDNERFSHPELDNGLYEISQANIRQEDPVYAVVALDPVNFEKPYATGLAGVSIVQKSTPPQLNGQARLTRGYPTMTAQDLVNVVLFTHTFYVTFTHARQTRLATINIGWFPIRLPTTHQCLWVLVAYEAALDRTLVLLTNVPLQSIQQVRSVYNDWRLRSLLNTVIALTKNKAWMLKICGCKPSNE